MKYRISHVTRYSYGEAVSLCHNLAHLKLRVQPGQLCFSSQVEVEPLPTVAREFRDCFGNWVNYFSVQQAHHELTVTALSEVDVNSLPLGDETIVAQSWEMVSEILGQGTSGELLEARLFTLDSPYVKSSELLHDYASPSFSPGRSLLDGVSELMNRIYSEFTYDPHFTDVATPLADVLAHRRGVCQDFAHFAIGCLRSLGLPARYVSGYLETLPPPGKPKLRGADASHAWFSVYVPGAGWLDFDPTNNQMPAGQHITTAVGRDFGDVTPVKGVLYGGGEHTLEVAVDVERLEE